MKVLALDSSGMTASVAIVDENLVLGEYSVTYKKTHSQTLLPMLDEVVKMTETDLKDIDAIAIASGPGSFTGLRIGSATAKGIAHGIDKPIIEVPTLEAMAYQIFCGDEIICPMLDARRNQVYTALYQWKDGTFNVIEESMAVSIEEIIEKVNAYNTKAIFLGDGSAAFREQIEREVDVPSRIAPVHSRFQRAAVVGSRAIEYYNNLGRIHVVEAKDHKPEYLRLSQAERERRERNADKEEILFSIMKKEDLKQVMKIERDNFTTPWTENGFLDAIDNKYYCLITAKTAEGRVVGYSGFYQSDCDANITNVAVAKKYRRRHIAEKMLTELMGIGKRRGVSDFTLEVRDSNAAAINLYKKLGFDSVGQRKNFYSNPVEDANIMWLYGNK